MLANLAENGYRLRKAAQLLASQALTRTLHRFIAETRRPTSQEQAAVKERFIALIESDLRQVREGWYPEQLLAEPDALMALKLLPESLVYFPKMVLRARQKRFKELPPQAQASHIPHYYRRTFHWQEDGWFSERSARRYEPSVELLFGGTAAVMRRMLIPDLVRALRGHEAPRVLDVACGTGSFLKQLHVALPHARFYGLDLSAAYLKYASEQLSHLPELSLVAENAEAMPFADATFDALSSIFLFHEVPLDARRAIFKEMFRVLKPGGTLAVLDSSQNDDSPMIKAYLDAFPELYHEPYYKGYLTHPLPTLMREAGFVIQDDRSHFLSRAVIAVKPA